MSQMAMVARLIDAGKNYLGMKRQIFFIQVGGYDTHTQQTTSASTGTQTNANVIIGAQANLLAELDQTLNALYLAMADLGVLRDPTNDPTGATMQSKVTAFTASAISPALSRAMVPAATTAGAAITGSSAVPCMAGPPMASFRFSPSTARATPAQDAGFPRPRWTSTPLLWPVGSESIPAISPRFSRIWTVLRPRTLALSNRPS